MVPPPLHALGHFKSVWKAEEVGKGEPLTTNSLLGKKKKKLPGLENFPTRKHLHCCPARISGHSEVLPGPM